jgi:putative ABC transport system ATP-binding protein
MGRCLTDTQAQLINATSTAEPAVELGDLEFAWPGDKSLLCIERLVIDRGERMFLSGPSGSGKSTLLGLIGGVLKPVTGYVRLIGTTVSNVPARQADRFRGDHVGFIFQSFNLIPYLSVLANVLLPLEFSRERQRRLAGAQPKQEAFRLLSALGLSKPDLLTRPVNRLSIGQQQRVAAARALIGRPEILIADEPTSSLDADARADFLGLLMAECARFQTSLLYVSHDRSLSALFDRHIELTDINRVRAAATGE